jgi:hypothetical protein
MLRAFYTMDHVDEDGIVTVTPAAMVIGPNDPALSLLGSVTLD